MRTALIILCLFVTTLLIGCAEEGICFEGFKLTECKIQEENEPFRCGTDYYIEHTQNLNQPNTT